MNILSKISLAALPFLAVFAGACTANTSDDPASSADDLSGGAAAPVGLFILEPGGADHDDRWINGINFHHDGTYDGNFGNDVSNLSGHFFLANGKYKVVTTPAGPAINIFGPSGTGTFDQYLYKATAAGFDFKFVTTPADGIGDQPFFSMGRGAPPITLAFNADQSHPQSATITGNATLLLRYEASREKCHGSQAGITGFVSVDGAPAQVVQMAESVNGFIDALVGIPEGKDLAVWFENTSGSCTFWDSNNTQNFHYTIK